MDGAPGVRNYGLVEPDELYDVYCFVDDLDGDVINVVGRTRGAREGNGIKFVHFMTKTTKSADLRVQK